MQSAHPDVEADVPAAAPVTSAHVRAPCPDDRRAVDGAEPRPRAVDVRLCEVDRLLRHVADRLRRSGVDLPDARLRHLSEELVVDVTRVVLAWAEEPLPAASRRASARRHRRRER